MKQSNNETLPAHHLQQRGWGFEYLVVLWSIILPACSILIEYFSHTVPLDPVLIGKWFIFWGFGARNLITGLEQAFNPAATAMRIFNLRTAKGFAVVKELGFLNICLGMMGILSLFFDYGKNIVAVTAAIYFLLMSVQRFLGKPADKKWLVVVIADTVLFSVVLLYLLFVIFFK